MIESVCICACMWACVCVCVCECTLAKSLPQPVPLPSLLQNLPKKSSLGLWQSNPYGKLETEQSGAERSAKNKTWERKKNESKSEH